MGISQQIGASSLSKPGVCTSSTRPATPYEGQQIYETDTDKVLVYNGTAWKQVPTAATAGAVLQVVYGSTTTQNSTSTSAYTDTTLTATITPSATSSKILVMVSQNGLLKQNNTSITLQLLRGATSISVFALEASLTSTTANNVTQASISYLDSPSTTSATIYKTQQSSAANIGNAFTQYGSCMSSITLMEISA